MIKLLSTEGDYGPPGLTHARTHTNKIHFSEFWSKYVANKNKSICNALRDANLLSMSTVVKLKQLITMCGSQKETD